ncbi:heterokaryon incompatibility protein-domain-containing protein [Hygrophoropsis aurantiaca]|uniref:Heterokaryon incompatibility protein-domain-containing protein n=1 Tax=Hygrophoropsis aurantiaca TaxID=72124 RepID=A0ACB7ZVN7_9AGAM|nr:heterokaryon incompatibility protein-domain-containing protein [Hygrophoropsis aurantiaca]
MCEWRGALEDAEHAIQLDHTSPWGYERKHAALHGAQDYGNAIEAFSTMLLKLENSLDPVTRKLRQRYVSPADVDRAIRRAINLSFQNFPLRLIETTTGRLCGRGKRINTFKATLDYKKLVSSMTTDATFDHEHIAEVVMKYFRYVMLSHRWDENEPLLSVVQKKKVYDLESLYPVTKLQRFCQTARDAGYNWAWSDTCCIDKTNSVELQQSLNSMFDWYRHSSLTIVYLSDVPPSSEPGALAKSVWTTRGWTLQEFLAPRVIRFFGQDWTPYLNDCSSNHKESTAIMQELEDATGIAARASIGFRPSTTEVRQTLQWASTRVTTVQEDVAYSLFGIFNVKLPVIYGENKQHALGRLLEEIIAQSGDVTALDWIGQPSEYNSCLPADIAVYKASAHTPLLASRVETETSVPELQSFTAEMALALYDKLDRQPPPRFANHRLTLPCIVFPLRALTKQTDGRSNVYSATADGLVEGIQITTADNFSPFSLSRPSRLSRGMLLVRPWNRDLLDAIDIASDVRNAVSAPLSSNVIPPGLASQPLPEFDASEVREALILIARLKQRFAALLLVRQRSGEYRRVASDHDIIAQVRDVNKLMNIRSIEIL